MAPPRSTVVLGALAAALVACGSTRAPIDAGLVDADAAVDAAVRPRAVLFVGNSYTYYGDLPVQIAAMAPATAPIVSTSIAIGGAALRDHWAGAARLAIETGDPDVVVLQGQSLEPLFAPEDFALHADRLAAAATTAGVHAVFFATWARRADDALYQDPRSGGSPAAMQDGLTAGYRDAATRNQAALAPVGEGFRLVLAEHPTLDLFDPDGSHPSRAGTYLAACVLVEAVTDLAPTDVAVLGLDAATRAIVQDAAHRALAATR